MTPAATGRSWAFASGARVELSAAVELADHLERIIAGADAQVDRAHLRRLRDVLSSQILAARLLIDAGASAGSIAEVGRRARLVIEEAEAAIAVSGDRFPAGSTAP